jgi:hypothetical protein
MLDYLRDDVPGPRVIAADPATSYSIPAYTGHQVMAFLDQHSSPNDPRGLTRILDARDALSPYTDLRRTLTILRAYGVDLVVVNGRFTTPVSTDYWSLTPDLVSAMHAKFAGHPELFRPVFAAPGAWVFALTDAARSGALPDDVPVARAFIAPRPAGGTVDGAFTMFGTRLPLRAVAAGDTVEFVTRWGLAQRGAMPPGNYTVFVRLETPYPLGPGYVPAFDKVYRKALEARTHRAWRLRTTHRPLHGVFGPDQWTYDEAVEDDYAVALPRTAAPGVYDVRLRMLRIPHYMNTTPRDYVSDADAFEGPIVGHITITAPSGAPAR